MIITGLSEMGTYHPRGTKLKNLISVLLNLTTFADDKFQLFEFFQKIVSLDILKVSLKVKLAIFLVGLEIYIVSSFEVKLTNGGWGWGAASASSVACKNT